MSNSLDGRRVQCDRPGCLASAPLPVGLSSVLVSVAIPESNAAGWLFVNGREGIHHYCPLCAPDYLARQNRPRIAPATDEERYEGERQ